MVYENGPNVLAPSHDSVEESTLRRYDWTPGAYTSMSIPLYLGVLDHHDTHQTLHGIGIFTHQLGWCQGGPCSHIPYIYIYMAVPDRSCLGGPLACWTKQHELQLLETSGIARLSYPIQRPCVHWAHRSPLSLKPETCCKVGC